MNDRHPTNIEGKTHPFRLTGFTDLICSKVAPDPIIPCATGGRGLLLPLGFFCFSSSRIIVNFVLPAAGSSIRSTFTSFFNTESNSFSSGSSSAPTKACMVMGVGRPCGQKPCACGDWCGATPFCCGVAAGVAGVLAYAPNI